VDPTLLKEIVDAAFVAAEAAMAAHPIVVGLLKAANSIIDQFLPAAAKTLTAAGFKVTKG
jgi:hypothetical protein